MLTFFVKELLMCYFADFLFFPVCLFVSVILNTYIFIFSDGLSLAPYLSIASPLKTVCPCLKKNIKYYKQKLIKISKSSIH